MNDLTKPRTLYDLLYAALLVGLWWIKFTFQLWRRTKYLEELLRRQEQRSNEREHAMLREGLERQNELVKILAEAFATGQKPTLERLLNDAERDWSLRSSKTPPGRKS